HLKGQSLQLKADYQAKAAEAQEAGQVQLAAGYKEAVATLEKAADCYERASQSYIAGKENDVTNWEKAKSSLEIVANYQVKACEAEQVGKIILAARYREQAARAQREADQYQQSIQGNIVSQESEHINPESIPNQQRQQRIDNSTKRKALSVCCEKWLAETGSVDGVSYVSNCITHVANRGLVRAFEKYRSNVIKAHNVGDDALALSWIQVAEDIQQAIEISIKKAEAFRNLELYCYPQSVYDAFRAKEAHFMTLYGIDQALENACNAMKEIAEYREEYIKTSILPQTPANIPPDMKEKKKIIEKLEFVAKYLRKAAEAYSLGKEQEYNCFKSVAECMEESINGSKAAVRAKEENDEEENDGELEALWLRTANQYEEIAKYYDQAVDVWSGGNTTECSYIDRIKEFIKEAYLNNIPNFLQPKLKDERYMFRFITDNNADRLHRAARALKKSLLDSGSDEAEISAFWRRVAEQYQLIVELNIQATQEEIKGNKAAATRLKEAANVTEDAVISAEETIDYWLGDGPPISLYGSLLLNSLPKQNNYL
ncbi:MAG TPA: hypothetical protein VJK54_11225, partial [Chthoniobacterales bacterium]|nr:hypothetical protein [Chthoniobacterales bacterium]